RGERPPEDPPGGTARRRRTARALRARGRRRPHPRAGVRDARRRTRAARGPQARRCHAAPPGGRGLRDRQAREGAGRAARSPRGGDMTSTPAEERVRVVIAEDEAIIRLDLKEILQDEGYEVVGDCGRGDVAIELVRELRPDVVILDIKMPGLDGIET